MTHERTAVTYQHPKRYQTNNSLSLTRPAECVTVRHAASGVLRGNSIDRNRRNGEIPLQTPSQIRKKKKKPTYTIKQISFSFSECQHHPHRSSPPCSNEGLFCHQRLYVTKSVINTMLMSWFSLLSVATLSFHWVHVPRRVFLPAALFQHFTLKSCCFFCKRIHLTSSLLCACLQ